MANTFDLSYTAREINDKLGKIDDKILRKNEDGSAKISMASNPAEDDIANVKFVNESISKDIDTITINHDMFINDLYAVKVIEGFFYYADTNTPLTEFNKVYFRDDSGKSNPITKTIKIYDVNDENISDIFGSLKPLIDTCEWGCDIFFQFSDYKLNYSIQGSPYAGPDYSGTVDHIYRLESNYIENKHFMIQDPWFSITLKLSNSMKDFNLPNKSVILSDYGKIPYSLLPLAGSTYYGQYQSFGAVKASSPDISFIDGVASIRENGPFTKNINARISYLEGGLLDYDESFTLEYNGVYSDGVEIGWSYYSPIEEGNPYTKVRLNTIRTIPTGSSFEYITVSYIDGVSADGTKRERLLTLDESTRQQIFDFVRQHIEETNPESNWLIVKFCDSYIEVCVEDFNNQSIIASTQIPYSIPTNLIFDCKDYEYLVFNNIDHAVEPNITISKLGFKKEN